MTFYNVISALLFIGAFRELARAFDQTLLPQIWMASCFAVIVFNDMLSTSYLVETKRTVDYDWVLQLIDLANFFVLAIALVAIHPGDNFFQVTLQGRLKGLTEQSFWFLLALYWLLLMAWSWRARLEWPGNRLKWSFGVAGIFLVECALVIWDRSSLLAEWGRFVVFAYVVVYLGFRVVVGLKTKP